MSDVDLPSLLTQSFQAGLNNVCTALPCMVVEIPNNLTDLRVHVQPLVNRKKKDGTSEEMNVLYNVPVIMMGSSTSMVSFPLHVGDTVLCVFSQRAIDVFKAGMGLPQTPSDFRKFDIRDAMAITGLYPFAKSLNNPAVRKWSHNTQDMVVCHNIGQATETEIRILNAGGIVINTDQDAVVNCKESELNCQKSTVNCDNSVLNTTTAEVNASSLAVSASSTTWTGDINHSGVFNNSGSVISTGKVLDTHVHGASPPPS